jgi:hypothetical protein
VAWLEAAHGRAMGALAAKITGFHLAHVNFLVFAAGLIKLEASRPKLFASGPRRSPDPGEDLRRKSVAAAAAQAEARLAEVAKEQEVIIRGIWPKAKWKSPRSG